MICNAIYTPVLHLCVPHLSVTLTCHKMCAVVGERALQLMIFTGGGVGEGGTVASVVCPVGESVMTTGERERERERERRGEERRTRSQ